MEPRPSRSLRYLRETAAREGDAERVLRTALGSGGLEMRIAAAEELERLGTEASLPALVGALENCFPRRSGRWHTAFGVAGSALCLLALAGIASGMLAPLSAWVAAADAVGVALLLISAAGMGVHRYLRLQALRREFVRALAAAIMGVTERTGSLRGRSALPLLRTTAADYVQADDATRTQARRVAEFVDWRTRDLEKLPVPAASPLTPEALPRPVYPQPLPEANLPRVRT